MDNYKDLFFDIDKYDEEKMVYIKPTLFYTVSKNMGIHYRENLDSKEKKKIIVLSPKMHVPFGIKEFVNNDRKSYQMSLSFNTLTNLYNESEIKKFHTFVEKVDSVNEETVSDNKKQWGLPKNMTYKKSLQRSSKEFPHHMNINLPYDEKHGFLFSVYDEKAVKSTIDIIEKRSIVSVVMELTDMRFSDTEYRSNWTALQIRKMKPYSPIQDFFMSGCFICDEDDPEDTAYSDLIEKYRKTLATPIAIPKMPSMMPNYQLMNQYMQHMQQFSPMPPIGFPFGQPAAISYGQSHGPYQPHNMYQPHSPYQPQITYNQPTITTSAETKQTQPDTQSVPMIGFSPPSLNELLDAKKALKKTKTVIKGTTLVGKVVTGDDNDNDNNDDVSSDEPDSTNKKSSTNNNTKSSANNNIKSPKNDNKKSSKKDSVKSSKNVDTKSSKSGDTKSSKNDNTKSSKNDSTKSSKNDNTKSSKNDNTKSSKNDNTKSSKNDTKNNTKNDNIKSPKNDTKNDNIKSPKNDTKNDNTKTPKPIEKVPIIKGKIPPPPPPLPKSVNK